MKKQAGVLIIWAGMVTFSANGQTTTVNQVVNATGGFISNGSYSIEYNVGEPAVSTISATSLTVTQGLLQPDIAQPNSVKKIKQHPRQAQVFMVYPSGAIVVKDETNSLRYYSLVNNLSQVMQQGTLQDGQVKTNLPAGIYYLQLYDINKQLVQVSPVVSY